MAQLNNELAEKELIKKFRHDNSWLGELRPKNNWVNNDVIKIPRRGAAPAVLINNGSYPILTNNRNDDFITLALNKYDTENTSVTDDELYALAYEKLSDVQMQHRETLEDKTAEHALHALATPKESATTPVIVTTGADDGTGRKRLLTSDLITLWKKLGELNVPLQGRVVVLSTEHAADLMMEDSARAKSWGADFQNGASGVMHVGFKLWVASYTPNYKRDSSDGNIWKRQAFEAVTGQPASVVFYKNNACKATGSVKRYAIDAANNPSHRQNEIGFRLWFIAVGIKDDGFAAIVSGSTGALATPVINGIAPSTVKNADTVFISGVNLTNVSAVNFGSTAATSFVVDSDNGITAVVPTLSNGSVNVTVVAPDGTSLPKAITVAN